VKTGAVGLQKTQTGVRAQVANPCVLPPRPCFLSFQAQGVLRINPNAAPPLPVSAADFVGCRSPFN